MTAGWILLLAAVLFPVAVRGTVILINHISSTESRTQVVQSARR